VDVGVDVHQFQPAQKASGGKVILFAGKFDPRKGVRLLLMAFEIAQAQDDELRLRLVGDGPGRVDEERWVAARGMDGKVEFAGRKTHAEMKIELRNADLFVFPSLRD